MQNQENISGENEVRRETDTHETDITTEKGSSTAETAAENETPAAESSANKSAELEAKVNELNDKYLRLYSEFDNYRKRTIKEKADIIKTASEDVLKSILPVIDDLERAVKANETIQDLNTIKEGVQLIYNKIKNTTQQKGLTALESIGETFNPDLMEAITHLPAADDSQKGKVIDEVEKGYKLGDKVIRFAKVVVAQ